MIGAVERLKFNKAWIKLQDRLQQDLIGIELALREPGEFNHGLNIGQRDIINIVLDFEDWAVENAHSKGYTKLQRHIPKSR